MKDLAGMLSVLNYDIKKWLGQWQKEVNNHLQICNFQVKESWSYLLDKAQICNCRNSQLILLLLFGKDDERNYKNIYTYYEDSIIEKNDMQVSIGLVLNVIQKFKVI